MTDEQQAPAETPTDEAGALVEAAAAAPAVERSEPEQVRAVWQAHFWGSKAGHEEVLELTELVKRTAKTGKLLLFDTVTDERLTFDVPALVRPPRAGRVRVRPGRV